jgi:hypothetical protein
VIEQYLVWVLLVGAAAGAAATWFVVGRLPRRSDDVSPPELAAEAGWISRVIEERGGVAPAVLVEEVLELHLEYVAGDPIDVTPADQQAAVAAPEAETAPQADAAPVATPTTPPDGVRSRRARRRAGGTRDR